MKFRRLLLSALLVVSTASFAWSVEPFMPRYPSISPDGNTIVFSFQGDLWRTSVNGGDAIRLTAHSAYDYRAVFSPDGKTIAFASNRYGDADVYTMPIEGGAPTRLTFASTTDAPYSFSADGQKVLFTSRRYFDFPMKNQVFEIPVEGGTPFRLVDMFGDEVAVSNEGDFYAIAAGRVKFGRVHYRGTYQREIYAYTPGQDPINLTNNRGYDTNPMMGADGKIYWIGDDNATKTQNIYAMNRDGSDKRQVTFFEGDGVRTAGMSQNGTLVLERETDLYVMAPGNSEPHKLSVNVAADLVENPVVIKNMTRGASEIDVSSSGNVIAMVIESEIVLVDKELGGRAVVPVPAPSRDEGVMFRPGSEDTLVFVTDRFGDKQVCLLVSDDKNESNLLKTRKHKIVQLTKEKAGAHSPKWSPDGENIAYLVGHGDLHVMNEKGKKDKLLTAHYLETEFNWSPDSRWIALAREDKDFNSDVWIMPADGGKMVNITQHPDVDMNPVWSEDGSMIAWSTQRHGNQLDVYYTYLTRELDERTKEEWEIWEKTRDKKPAKKDDDKEDKKKDDEEKKEEFKVNIDFEDIHLRGRRMTNMPEDEFVVAIHPKGDKIYFAASIGDDRNLFAVNRFGDDRENLTNGSKFGAIYLDPKAKKFYLLSHGKPGSMGMDGGKIETVDFKARITIDKPARRSQILEEGWRVIGANFYDKNMHGVDWNAVHKKYSKWVTKVSHDNDFAAIVNMMLGELDASHMGYYPSWESEGEYATDGYLGLGFDKAYTGKGLKIAHVLPYGPSDNVKTRLQKDDIILSIDGMNVGNNANIYAALENNANIPVEITFKRNKETMSYDIVPSAHRAIRNAVYSDMERLNRSYVENKTKGRIGYLHIREMGLSEVERFELNLYAAAHDKEALIIDVRENGGGWTTDYLMTILTQPVHAYTIPRDGEIGYPQHRYPLYRWTKPIAVICNEGSYSNAEIFSHAVKTNGRGPVVGKETGGNVISTGGWSTLDGGWIRLPFRGFYVFGDKQNPARNNKNQEGNETVGDGTGAMPDYPVDFTPADLLHNRHPQLDKAIELMIDAADEAKNLPKPEKP